MKQALLLLFLFLLATASAQVCTNPQSQINLHGNNISARILNAGDLFSDLSRGAFIPGPDENGLGPSTLYSAGLWLGGIDAAGNLRLDAVTYRLTDETDFFAGPLAEDGTTNATDCSNWDRHFIVRGNDVEAFLNALPLLANDPELAKMQFPNIMGWPGIGNPFFQDLWGFELPVGNTILAPFFDADQNGVYNPLQGDYPVVALRDKQPFVADEMVWCVFNDQGAGAPHQGAGSVGFPVEVQLTAWAFDDPSQPVLSNTVFTSHKMIFRTTENLDSCFVGIWADFDIGCYGDDYVGTAPGLNSIYAYNSDAVDGWAGNNCNGTSVFESAPPVQSATFLNASLDKSIANASGAPYNVNTPFAYYNLLNGHWPDGQALLYGGNGYVSDGDATDYIFPDDPNNASGWSMCTVKQLPADRQMLGSHRIGEVLPGQVEELTVAWSVHPNPALPCGLGNTFENIAGIQDIFDHDFYGGVLSAPFAPTLSAAITLQPNPAMSLVSIGYQKLPVLEIRCFDAAGRLIRTEQNLPPAQYELDVSGWHTGVYTLQLLTPAGMAARQLVVLR